MTDRNHTDIPGMPTDPAELRAWALRLRSLFRLWANAKGATPEEGFKKASSLMKEIRAMIGEPTAEEEVAIMRDLEAKAAADGRQAAAAVPVAEIVAAMSPAEKQGMLAGAFLPLTVEQVRAAKWVGAGMGDGSDKNGKFAVRFGKCVDFPRLMTSETMWLRKGSPPATRIFFVDVEGILPGEGAGPQFDTLDAAVEYMNANPVGGVMGIEIKVGDCRDVLKTLADQSVQCCVTSPPYFGLRDYGVADQIGLEPTPDEFVEALVQVFREVRRVLRDDGTLWLNLGDSYAHSLRQSENKAGDKQNSNAGSIRRGFAPNMTGLKEKDLIGIPWMVAFALRADGWYLRQDIIWSKPNPMPESVQDRCTKAHEYVFLLSKSDRYYFDAEAIAEPLAAASVARLAQDVDGQEGSDRVPGKTNGRMKAVAKGNRKTFRGGGVYTQGQSFDNDAVVANDSIGNEPNQRGLRNKRSVWTVATQPFKEAHFATFPPALIEPCILAGCPVGGTVLDPFGGAGTTGLVADRLGRNAILIELNPEYAEIARRRLSHDAGMFAEVM